MVRVLHDLVEPRGRLQFFLHAFDGGLHGLDGLHVLVVVGVRGLANFYGVLLQEGGTFRRLLVPLGDLLRGLLSPYTCRVDGVAASRVCSMA